MSGSSNLSAIKDSRICHTWGKGLHILWLLSLAVVYVFLEIEFNNIANCVNETCHAFSCLVLKSSTSSVPSFEARMSLCNKSFISISILPFTVYLPSRQVILFCVFSKVLSVHM